MRFDLQLMAADGAMMPAEDAGGVEFDPRPDLRCDARGEHRTGEKISRRERENAGVVTGCHFSYGG